MKINIYYGGRGVIDDPTNYVLNKIEHALMELRVEVERYNIYEHKNSITTLPQTMKDADAIILATTVEWLGIGGYMTQFLDACWLYGDKDVISKIYMQPVVMATTYGEREAMLTLENAWEILGGMPCTGLCGYVDDMVAFEGNKNYVKVIEKTAETLYRTVAQRTMGLPASNQAIANSVQKTKTLNLTPEEGNQLSEYAADDEYVRQQKSDIKELSGLFKNMLGQGTEDAGMEYVTDFIGHFAPVKGFSATYLFNIEGKSEPLFVGVDPADIEAHYGPAVQADVTIHITRSILGDIISGRETFQRAFSVGDLSAKGDFKTVRMLDEVFTFSI